MAAPLRCCCCSCVTPLPWCQQEPGGRSAVECLPVALPARPRMPPPTRPDPTPRRCVACRPLRCAAATVAQGCRPPGTPPHPSPRGTKALSAAAEGRRQAGRHRHPPLRASHGKALLQLPQTCHGHAAHVQTPAAVYRCCAQSFMAGRRDDFCCADASSVPGTSRGCQQSVPGAVVLLTQHEYALRNRLGIPYTHSSSGVLA